MVNGDDDDDDGDAAINEAGGGNGVCCQVDLQDGGGNDPGQRQVSRLTMMG